MVRRGMLPIPNTASHMARMQVASCVPACMWRACAGGTGARRAGYTLATFTHKVTGTVAAQSAILHTPRMCRVQTMQASTRQGIGARPWSPSMNFLSQQDSRLGTRGPNPVILGLIAASAYAEELEDAQSHVLNAHPAVKNVKAATFAP